MTYNQLRDYCKDQDSCEFVTLSRDHFTVAEPATMCLAVALMGLSNKNSYTTFKKAELELPCSSTVCKETIC